MERSLLGQSCQSALMDSCHSLVVATHASLLAENLQAGHLTLVKVRKSQIRIPPSSAPLAIMYATWRFQLMTFTSLSCACTHLSKVEVSMSMCGQGMRTHPSSIPHTNLPSIHPSTHPIVPINTVPRQAQQSQYL